MQLLVEWIEPTKGGQEKTRVEKTYADAILEFFENGVEKAQKAKTRHQAQPNPISDWNRANMIAAQTALQHLSPSEKLHNRFRVEFVEHER